MAYIKDGMEEAFGRKWTKRLIVIATVILIYCVVSFSALALFVFSMYIKIITTGYS